MATNSKAAAKGREEGNYYGNPSVERGESQYVKAMRGVKKDKAAKKRERYDPINICGAKKRSGGKCLLASGWGTNHKGTGRCRIHGGTAPSQIAGAAKGELRKLLGHPLEINPLDALLMCIRISAGEVKWLSDEMAKLQEKDFIEETIVGKQFHLYARERKKSMQDLARYSHMAISLGIAERAVKLAETYGEMLAALIQGILGDLELTPEQRARAPKIVRSRLLAIDTGLYGGSPPGKELELAKANGTVAA